MHRAIIAPSRYVQGYGELQRIREHVKQLGTTFLVIADDFVMSLTRDTIERSFKDSDKALVFQRFNGECSRHEIERLADISRSNKADAVIGVGGGKTLDTAKAVAYYCKVPVVIVPTIASTDAPCSALSVIYTEEGVFEEYLLLPKNPDVVLVDTAIVSKAPVRLLVAGMGDALATYFEARAAAEANKPAMAGGKATEAALALARLCYDTLLNEGLKAKLAVENQVCTEAVEQIVEANTYLSGIGFESGGLAAAHAIHNGLTVLEKTHQYYHGEKVAFGTLVQLVLENSSLDEIEEVLDFCTSVGLPITLAQLGIEEIKPEDIRKVAEAACAEGETIYNMPVEITVDAVYAAIIAADALGREYLGEV